MISKRISYICEDFEKIENYEQAIADTENMWICHHRLELDEEGHRLNTMQQLKAKNMYYHRPPEELIFLTKADHWNLHMNEEQKERLSTHQKKLWESADKLREVKAKAKKRRDEGLNLVNIEQLSSKSAYRDYQRLQHRLWYDKNREGWNDYTYKRNLAKKSIKELEQLIERHKNSILLNTELNKKTRIEKLNHYIEIIEKEICDRLEEINRQNNAEAWSLIKHE